MAEALPRINLSTDPLHTPAGSGWASGFVQPRVSLRCDRRTLRSVARSGERAFKQWDDPLEALAWMSGEFPFDDGGRWIGHISYDLGRLFENLPQLTGDDLDVPLFHFTYCMPLRERPSQPEPDYATGTQPIRSTFTRGDYERAVRRAIDYIAAGDVFQVNLSQRFTLGLPRQPAELYSTLSRQTPGQYGALLSYGDYAIISNSPELFLRVTPDRRVLTRPIKGTRPRGDGMREQLLGSTKDQAELNMIVDLERNDLGRVCEIGSVRVVEPRTVEEHPTVYHGVAGIEGRLRAEVGFVDLLRATFPGGSVTGAPKIRAMQIIEELEPVRRGPYCGAVGYLSGDGSVELNVAIRTMVVRDGLVHVSVGGGVVADSDPAAEYEETLVKAYAMLGALGIDPAAAAGAAGPGTASKPIRAESRVR